MRPDVAMLGEIPLFELLGETEKATLAELLESVRYRKGETIFRTGELGNSLFIIRTGRVRVLLEDDQGQRIVLGEGGPGELFGEVSLLDGGPRTASVIALTDVLALSLDRDDLLELITLRPTAALSLMTVMGRRQRANSGLLRGRGPTPSSQTKKAQLSASQRFGSWAAAVFGSFSFLILAASALIAAYFAPIWGESRPPLEILMLALLGLVFVQVTVALAAANLQSARDRLKANREDQFHLQTEMAFAQVETRLDHLGEQLRSIVAGSEAAEALGRSTRPPSA